MKTLKAALAVGTLSVVMAALITLAAIGADQVAAKKPLAPQERRAQNELRMKFNRTFSKLSKEDMAAIDAVLKKYGGSRTNAPAAKPAPVKKK